MDVTPAYTITFLNSGGGVLWSRKIAKNLYITEEFLSSGPNGALTTPTKQPSASHTYTFSDT
jgi:hypothetical protein